MKSLLTKRIIIIFSVILVITVGSIILAFALNNTHVPQVENGNEIVYQKLDSNGKVVYTITKQELYEEMKRNNGLNQILSIMDTKLLADYLDNITEAEVAERIQFLTYQTNDQTVIDNYLDEVKEGLEENYRQLIILSGYHGREEDFAKLLIARENYVRDVLVNGDDITENEIADYYFNNYFEDIDAIRLRFLSKDEATAVLRHFNLGKLNNELAYYLGYTYKNETIKDSNSEIIEAQITIDTYYFNSRQDILNVLGQTIYKFENEIYTDQDDNTFTLDPEGNLLDDEENLVVSNTLIFDSKTEAEDHKEANTTYFKLVKNNDVIEVYDLDQVLVYTIEDGKILDLDQVDVTDSIDLRINKEFTAIEDVKAFTSNNTETLTNEEVLSYYIQMYNYLYSEYRETLDENATIEDLIALDSPLLQFNFETVKGQNATLATYMFSDISQLNDLTYTSDPRSIGEYTYMVYKLSEGVKYDMKEHVFNVIKSSIELPKETNTNLTLPLEGPYGATISWRSSSSSVIANNGTVTLPTQDTRVTLTYTIKALGITQSGTVPIGVKVTTDPSDEMLTIVENPMEEITLFEMINDDDLIEAIRLLVIDQKVKTSSVVQSYLVDARKDAELKIYDYYLALDYQQEMNADYKFVNGKDNNLASIKVNGSTVYLKAEDFYQESINRNPSLMIFYASQFKEALYSDHFTKLFGTQRNIDRNNSDLMKEMRSRADGIKSEYTFFVQNPQIYEYYQMMYGYNFNLESYQTYLYSRYHIYNEASLIQNLILGELRLSYVKDVIDSENLIDLIYEVVETNYDNFFSLDTEHLLIFFDFDEDGKTDDYKKYYDTLSASEQNELESLIAQLATIVRQSSKSLTDIAKEYDNASREDEVWGVFKQKGFILKQENLNTKVDNNTTVSLNYNAVKYTYAEEFTAALIDLYAYYQDPLNIDADSILSPTLTETSFGVHMIKVIKGTDFGGISAQITEGVSASLMNPNDKPTKAQIETYLTYQLYSSFYDLDEVDVESLYGIALPTIPNDLFEALDFYASETLEPIFGTYLVNYAYIKEIMTGEVKSSLTQAYFDENMDLLLDIYRKNTIDNIVR